MIKSSYIRQRLVYFFIVLLIVVAYLEQYLVLSSLLIIFGIVYLFYARRDIYIQTYVPGVIFSPSFGKVTKIHHSLPLMAHYQTDKLKIPQSEYMAIDISLKPFEDMGLFFPFTGELIEVIESKGSKLWSTLWGQVSTPVLQKRDQLLSETKNSKKSKFTNHFFKFNVHYGEEFIIQIFPSKFFGKCYFFLQPGDFGHHGALMGILSWGGIIRFYIPKNYDIVVNTHDSLVPAESILAKRKIE
jgi:hypothetical protein